MLKSFFEDNVIEAGCDEAGRGCLAGPVFAAAVILPPDYKNETLNDSKKLSEKVRYNLRPEIESEALAFAVSSINNVQIDEMNILRASIFAMQSAITKLTLKPEHLIIDGNRFYAYPNIPHTCIVKGDSKYVSIAAASILAKTYRDDYMVEIGRDFPEYNWSRNKGYPTKKHRSAIQNYGPTKYHRRSFQLLDKQLQLEL